MKASCVQIILLVVATCIYGIGSTRPSAHARTTCRNSLCCTIFIWT